MIDYQKGKENEKKRRLATLYGRLVSIAIKLVYFFLLIVSSSNKLLGSYYLFNYQLLRTSRLSSCRLGSDLNYFCCRRLCCYADESGVRDYVNVFRPYAEGKYNSEANLPLNEQNAKLTVNSCEPASHFYPPKNLHGQLKQNLPTGKQTASTPLETAALPD